MIKIIVYFRAFYRFWTSMEKNTTRLKFILSNYNSSSIRNKTQCDVTPKLISFLAPKYFIHLIPQQFSICHPFADTFNITECPQNKFKQVSKNVLLLSLLQTLQLSSLSEDLNFLKQRRHKFCLHLLTLFHRYSEISRIKAAPWLLWMMSFCIPPHLRLSS